MSGGIRGRIQEGLVRSNVGVLLREVGRGFERSGLVSSFEIFKEHDIHAFYRLSRDQDRVVHVQGYPGMSTESEARVFARLMDYNKMMEIRRAGGVSIGNEHLAVVQDFPNFEFAVEVPYDPRVLRGMLEENVPELRG